MSIYNFLFYAKKEFAKCFKKCCCISFNVVNIDATDISKEVEITKVYLDSIKNKGFRKIPSDLNLNADCFYEISI